MEAVLFLIILIINLDASRTERCFVCQFEHRCRCCNNTEFLDVDCSRQNISHFPIFPSNTRSISLASNRIQSIRNDTFKTLTHLIALNVANNELRSLKAGAFTGLLNLHMLSLEHNYLDYSTSTYPEHVFEPLSSLVLLNVKFNAHMLFGGSGFPDKVIADLKNLETIDIDCTGSVPISPFGKGFFSLKRLIRLRIGRCSWLSITENTFSNTPYLEYIDLSRCNLLNYFENTLQNLLDLRFLDISYGIFYWDSISSLMKDLNSTSIQTLIMARLFARKIEEFPSDFFVPIYHSRIKEIYLEWNFFSVVKIPDELPPSLKILDFDNNQLKSIMIEMPYLSCLYLRNNSLGNFLASQKYTQNITELTTIDLSLNAIHHLTFTIFQGHPNLEVVNLSHNSLLDIEFDLPQVTTWRTLDLSNNLITTFNQSTMENIDHIFKISNLQLDLSNNILHCNCRTVSFLRWIYDNVNHFRFSHKYVCKFDNGVVRVVKPLKLTVLELEKECASHIVLILCISIAMITVCSIIVGGLIYRYRWKLRYLYYLARAKQTTSRQFQSDRNCKYNAFISYSEEDRKFIMKECIPNLEHNGINLCVHERDFIPGEDITVNITNAIHQSKKTICIITRSFLNSYYCMFEFNMARMESIYSRNGENILFLVFYDQILPRELPLVMLELVQKQTYLEYPNDEQGNVVFWEKIKDAIV